MCSYKYLVTISNEDNIVRGNLKEVNSGNRQANFNPLTVLGDLLDIVTYTGISPHPQDSYSLNEDYKTHPFFLGHEYKGNPLFKETYCLQDFFLAVNELKVIITSNSRFSMNKFEILKQFLSLRFTYKIEFREINPLYKLGYKENPINLEPVNEYQYMPLKYTYDYNMKFMFDDNNESPHKFTYTCFEIKDIIFSVLHYLVLLEYKFSRCEHCRKYFATKDLSHVYCNRNSPYKGREDLACGEAVDRLMTKIMKRKKSIKAYLYDYYPHNANKFLYEFSTYKSAVKSVSNLEMLEFITSKNYVKNKWYRDESIKSIMNVDDDQ